jgi:hypothetical protein
LLLRGALGLMPRGVQQWSRGLPRLVAVSGIRKSVYRAGCQRYKIPIRADLSQLAGALQMSLKRLGEIF